MLRTAFVVAASVATACRGRSAPACDRGVDTTGLLQLQPGVAAHCPVGHESYGGSEALDVAWATDHAQVDGLKASVASAIVSTEVPVRAHIIVLRSATPLFQKIFGIRPGCLSVEAAHGRAVVILHPFDKELVSNAIPMMNSTLLAYRGNFDAPEQAVRLYMQRLFRSRIVVWLDCDTIVRKDLTPLRTKLLESNRTVGFSDRWNKWKKIGGMMDETNPCHFEPEHYHKLLKMTNYNIGVYVVDLERWERKRMTEQIEEFVRQHNACGGKLWYDADQVPFLLSLFLPALRGEPQDFAIFGEEWNVDGLGYKPLVGLGRIELKEGFEQARVLHWTGPHKPWLARGWHRQFWTPYFDLFPGLFPGSEVVPDSE